MENAQTEQYVKIEDRDVVFLSHAYADMEIAFLLKKALEGAFPSATIFDSSDPSSTQPREEWVRKVLEHLQRSSLVVVIATDRSMRRPWVWFEAGAAWGPTPNFVTCCVGAMHKGNLPAPFSNYTGGWASLWGGLNFRVPHSFTVLAKGADFSSHKLEQQLRFRESGGFHRKSENRT